MTTGIILTCRHAIVLRRSWLAIALLTGADIVWMERAGVRLSPHVYHVILPVTALLIALSLFYRHLRRDDAIWLSSQLVSQLLAGSCALAIFSYMGLRLNYPLMDASFIAADERIGFNWTTYIDWVNGHPWIAHIYTFCYRMTGPEIIILLGLLSFSYRFTYLHRFVLGYLLGGCITVVTANYWPALSAYIYHNIDAAAYPMLQVEAASDYQRDFFAMRNHTMVMLPEELQGVVAFPSFHSTIAILAIAAATALPSLSLRCMIIAINLIMLLSTPVDGGHYLMDTLGGTVVGLLVVLCAAKWMPKDPDVSPLKAP